MKAKGFSLIELMIAIAMATAVIAVMTSSFSSLNGDFLYSWNLMDLRRELRVSLNLMLKEVRNSGTFGNLSFHNQYSPNIYESAGTGAVCSDDWCRFDSSSSSGIGVGVRSYTASNLPSNVVPGSMVLAANSNLLRIQYGSNSVAVLNFNSGSLPYLLESSNHCVTKLDFAANNLVTSKIYMLSSSNRAYLVNLSAAKSVNSLLNNSSSAACGTFTPYLAIESYALENSVIYTPDVYTMTLSNFYSSYYFVGTQNGIKGLYMRRLKSDGSTLSDTRLVSKSITNLQVSYQILFGNSGVENFNNYDRTNGSSDLRYYWCSTEAMYGTSSDSDANSVCQNKWNRIVAINLEISGQSDKTVSNGSSADYLTQSESESVGWLW